MGLWGAAQAIAFGAGGLLGTLASDLARHAFASTPVAYGVVFCAEALLFVISALLAMRAATALTDSATLPGRTPTARTGGASAPEGAARVGSLAHVDPLGGSSTR